MSAPANLYPGLNDITDVLEELPNETARYFTLLHEIDAKCVHSMPNLNQEIDAFVSDKQTNSKSEVTDKLVNLSKINQLFEELIPSLEEKMHVSSIMLKSLEELTMRLEMAYEVAIKNKEIPERLRLGVDNHPAMHLHQELMQKIEATKNGSNGSSKSSQSLKSETRREAMAANRKQNTIENGKRVPNEYFDDSVEADIAAQQQQPVTKKRATNIETTEFRKRKAPNVNGRTTGAGSASSVNSDKIKRAKTNEYGEPLYCYCYQIAYGEMVGCDGPQCKLEWFHLPCIGLTTLPKGKWYCDDCKKK